jgi:hypothetical protein
MECMADVRTAWSQAGEQLSGLGQKLKLHYEEQRTDETGEQVRAQDEVKDAVRKLGTAVQDAVDAMGAAAKDQAVKDDVRSVGRSLRDALGVTFSEISDELGKAFGQGRQPTDRPDDARPEEARPEEARPEGARPDPGAWQAATDAPAYGTTLPPDPEAPAPPPAAGAKDREPGDPTP